MELSPNSSDAHVSDLVRRCKALEGEGEGGNGRSGGRRGGEGQEGEGEKLHRVGSTEEQEEVEK